MNKADPSMWQQARLCALPCCASRFADVGCVCNKHNSNVELHRVKKVSEATPSSTSHSYHPSTFWRGANLAFFHWYLYLRHFSLIFPFFNLILAPVRYFRPDPFCCVSSVCTHGGSRQHWNERPNERTRGIIK